MSLPTFFKLLSGALLGGAFGSFVSATAWAWLNDRPFLRARSVCDQCGASLSPLSLIPVISYLCLGGECRACGRSIPFFHFLMELIPAALGAALVLRYGIDWLAVCYVLLTAVLACASLIDLRSRRLPDFATLGPFVLLPPVICLNPELTLADSLIGCAIGGGVPFALLLLFRVARGRDGLGLGDVKLFALAGAFLGWSALPFLFFASACAGVLAFIALAPRLGRKIWRFRLPFGPFVAAAFVAILIFPNLPRLFYNLL